MILLLLWPFSPFLPLPNLGRPSLPRTSLRLGLRRATALFNRLCESELDRIELRPCHGPVVGFVGTSLSTL